MRMIHRHLFKYHPLIRCRMEDKDELAVRFVFVSTHFFLDIEESSTRNNEKRLVLIRVLLF